MNRAEVYHLIDHERERQAALRESGKFRFVASDADCPDDLKLAALVEEVGEVARAYHDGNDFTGELVRELVQVAAVAVAWLESRRP